VLVISRGRRRFIAKPGGGFGNHVVVAQDIPECSLEGCSERACGSKGQEFGSIVYGLLCLACLERLSEEKEMLEGQ
jgi:hypothetical protein